MVTLTPHLGPGQHMPDTVVVEPHIAGIVDCLVAALHHEAAVQRIQVEVVGGVAKTEAVVEAAFSILLDDEIGVAHCQQLRHRDQRQGAIGAAPGELVLRGVEVAEPHPGNKVGIGRLEGGEVTVQGQQNERVLLDVVPASLDPVGQQSSHDLGDEIRLGSHRDQSIEHDGVGAAVGMQQQIGVFRRSP